MGNKKKTLPILIIAFIVSVSILFQMREKLLLAVGDFLVLQDQLQPADVIHVIAGNDYRTDYAIQLYKQGYAKVIFFTGGWCIPHGYFHGEHGMQRSLAQGVPDEAALYDDTTVKSTYDEAVRLKAYIEKNKIKVQSIIVVSDPFHMRRARWTYHKILGDKINVQMAPVSFSKTPYTRYWWTDKESRQYVKEEYQKMVYYIARYQIAVGPFKEWLSNFDRY